MKTALRGRGARRRCGSGARLRGLRLYCLVYAFLFVASVHLQSFSSAVNFLLFVLTMIRYRIPLYQIVGAKFSVLLARHLSGGREDFYFFQLTGR